MPRTAALAPLVCVPPASAHQNVARAQKSRARNLRAPRRPFFLVLLSLIILSPNPVALPLGPHICLSFPPPCCSPGCRPLSAPAPPITAAWPSAGCPREQGCRGECCASPASWSPLTRDGSTFPERLSGRDLVCGSQSPVGPSAAGAPVPSLSPISSTSAPMSAPGPPPCVPRPVTSPHTRSLSQVPSQPAGAPFSEPLRCFSSKR